MGSEMSSSNNQHLSEKRANFLHKVDKESKPEEHDGSTANSASSASKPKGTFLERPSEQPRPTVERKAPSCGYKGG
jgi:hypothetical protein